MAGAGRARRAPRRRRAAARPRIAAARPRGTSCYTAPLFLFLRLLRRRFLLALPPPASAAAAPRPPPSPCRERSRIAARSHCRRSGEAEQARARVSPAHAVLPLPLPLPPRTGGVVLWWWWLVGWSSGEERGGSSASRSDGRFAFCPSPWADVCDLWARFDLPTRPVKPTRSGSGLPDQFDWKPVEFKIQNSKFKIACSIGLTGNRPNSKKFLFYLNSNARKVY
jgi:hypothetical protein